MTLKILITLTFVNLGSIIAKPQYPNLQPPGPPREPAPIYEPQNEDTLNLQQSLFTSYNNAYRQYYVTDGLSHNIPAYSTSAIRASTLFSPHTSISNPVYSTSNNYVKSYSTPVASSGASVFLPVDQNQARTTVTYSDAPLVSHVSFSGLGSSYSW